MPSEPTAEKTLTCPVCDRRYAPPTVQCTVDGSALYGPEASARLGQRLGNYELLSIIGVGGMGVVYKGQHYILEKPVAVKVLADRYAAREGGVEQFLREAKAATRIRHPNIVDVTDFGTAPDGSVYFVMEYLEGISLEDVLARDGKVPLFNAVNIVRQIAWALAAAHDEGIVHRDLKPENILLVNREGRRRVLRRMPDGGFVVEKEANFDFVKLVDFGVAKYTMDDVGPSATTRAGLIFGTPQYMSPEQARGEAVDGRSDIYALGILFYEMICGDVPFDGETALDILNGHVSGEAIPPSKRNPTVTVDPGTDRTVLRCLAKDPGDRYQTMYELIEALTGCFTDQVFLRDAHLMPGALEAGIVAPPIPRPITGGPPSPERARTITDDLTELFAGNVAGDGQLEADGPPTPPPTSTKELEQVLERALDDAEERAGPERPRRVTAKGLGVVQVPLDDDDER